MTTYGLNSTPYIDPLGRPRTVTRPDDGLAGGGRTTTTHYLPKKTTVVDPAGHKTVQLVDTYGRTVRTELFENPNDTTPHSYAETTYDGAGRVLTTRQNGDTDTTVTHTYDLLGRKLTTVDPDSGTWTYKYDPAGNLIYQNDPKTGQHIELCYDVINRPTGKFYYANDTQQSPTCPGNPTIAYTYDDPADYYGKGQLARVRDRSGEVTYRYDARGRLASEEREITIDGDTTRAEFTYQYDAADRPWKVHYPGGEVVQTDYDSSGQPFRLHSTTGSVTEEIVQCATYDLLGRPMRVQRANLTVDLASYHGTQSGPTRFARDHWLAGRQVQKLDGSATYLNLAYDGYDPRGFVTQVTDHRDASGARSNSATYGYDFAGRLRTANGPAVNESYGFDPLGNLTQVGSVNLGYGDDSRPHQVTSKTVAGALKYIQHDTNGNRRAKDSGAQEYTFDEDDRVVEITVDGPPFSAVQVGYDYTGRKTTQVSSGAVNLTTRYYSPLAEVEDDGVTSYYLQYYFFGGQRVASRRTTNTYWELASQGVFEGSVRLAAGSVERPALTVVLGPAAQTAAALGFGGLAFGLVLLPAARRRRAVVGVRLRRRPTACLTLLWVVATLPWPLVVMPVPVQAGNGQVPFVEWRHYHPDHLGSLQVITNGAALNIENVRYTPYGQIRGRWNADGNPVSLGLTSRHEFTGYETETASGLEYAGARVYDPVLGSFLTHDPARQFANPYSYVGGNPVNAVDPNGESAELLFGLLIAFGIGFAVSAIGAAAQGADAGAAFKAGAIGGAIGAASFAGLSVVGYGLEQAAGAALSQSFMTALSGTMSAYGIAESARSGNLVGLSAAVVGLAYSVSGAYDLLSQGGGSQSKESGIFREDMEQLYGSKIERASMSSGSGQSTVTVVTTYDEFGVRFGSHSAVHVSGTGEDILFDPAGGYRSRERGSGDYFSGPEADLKDFIAHHARVGSQVKTQSIAVTTNEANLIIGRIQAVGSTPGFMCTSACVGVLDGVGPFQGLSSDVGLPIPGNLYNAVEFRMVK